MNLLKRAALCALLLIPGLASAQYAVSGTKVLNGSGTPLLSGQWCFGASCITVTNGAFSGFENAGTATVTVTDGGSNTYLSVPGVVISGPFVWDTFVVPTNAQISGLGIPQIACMPGSSYTQTDSNNAVWSCTNVNGQNVWARTNPPSSSPSGIYAGTGVPTFSCSSPCTYVQADASTQTNALWAIVATPATVSTNWKLQGGGGASFPGVTSDGSNGLAVTGGVAAATTTAQHVGLANTCTGQQFAVASAVTQYNLVSLGTSGISPSGTGGGPVRGIAQATTSSGNVDVCYNGLSSVIMDGTATAGDVAVPSTTTGGEARDSGQTSSNNVGITTGDLGVIVTGCTGSGCTATVALKGSDQFGRSLKLAVINGVSYQANYPQSDFGGRANACITDAETLANGNTTHICNAQGDTSTSASPAYITSQVNCGDTTGDPVTWILPYGYIHMSGFTGGTSSGIKRYTGCKMISQAPIVASASLGNIAHLRIINTSAAGGLYAMYTEAVGTGSVSPFSEMSGILFDSNGESLANSANAVIILNIGNDRSYDHDFDVTYAVAGQEGIAFGGTAGSGTATCCSYVLQRVTTNGNFTGGTGLAISGYVSQAAVYDSTFGHTATGYPEITCNNVSPSQVQVDFYNIYVEESHDTTTPPVQDNGCTRLSFHGVTVRPGAVSSTAPFLSMVSNDGAWTIDGLSMTSFGSDTFTYPATAVSNAVSGSNCTSTPCLLKTDANGQLGQWAYNPGVGYNKQQTCGVSLSWAGAAIPAGTYTVGAKCFNSFGTTYYISGVSCYSDNSGTSTANVANNSATGLLTGAITLSPSWPTGTQSSTTSIPNGAWTNWTFVADGTSTIIQCNMQTVH